MKVNKSSQKGESSCAYRLVVGEAQGGHVLVLEGKLLEVLDDLGELGKNKIQGTLQEDQVGIVGDCEVSGCVLQANHDGCMSE
jgi:hypothetical protein